MATDAWIAIIAVLLLEWAIPTSHCHRSKYGESTVWDAIHYSPILLSIIAWYLGGFPLWCVLTSLTLFGLAATDYTWTSPNWRRPLFPNAKNWVLRRINKVTVDRWHLFSGVSHYPNSAALTVLFTPIYVWPFMVVVTFFEWQFVKNTIYKRGWSSTIGRLFERDG